jgi:hypothetical protein
MRSEITLGEFLLSLLLAGVLTSAGLGIFFYRRVVQQTMKEVNRMYGRQSEAWSSWSSKPVGARNSVTSCDLGLFVEQAAEPVASDDLDVGVDRVRERPERTGVVQCPVRPVPVEMGLILGQDLAQVRGVDDKHPVEDLVARCLPSVP